ncbi:glucosamine-6-phosphate deaminase [[Bacillus] enclensis]|uniref:Glucosamine-6-phosphate deaminase n=1 Tax=[Bacillus] enclensis TaxID=1402860 RepID=A0A0V8HCQ8_9BACI|nr:glucosamine-6-phosphate deaminase [[Bacillus] enclensis]KSU60297.1 glucosamine-6-phosphate deaminase [[Bacillus] enclensis]SCC22777.1 glucosamine-6-phosphate deaminase [[Bacillus] enclensis]
MKIIEVKNYEEMSKRAADYVVEKVRSFPGITLGLATGGTPLGLYRHLIEDHRNNLTSYQNVTTFNLDEYAGCDETDPHSYRYFMNESLFNHIDINKANTFIPRGDGEDMEREAQEYEQLIASHGGIDLQILGIGSNGHIGFNEPGTSFQSQTHIVELTDSTREANARFFDRIEDVPLKAITMGIATIMRSKEILLLVSGPNKREAFSRLMHEEVNEQFPVSVLKNHPAVTVMIDQAAGCLDYTPGSGDLEYVPHD